VRRQGGLVKLVGRIPVEPLDDERLTNIERRIVAGAADAAVARAPRESRLHFALGFAALAVVVLGAGVVGWKLHTTDAPVVAEAPLRIDTDREHRSTIDIGDARITSSVATAFAVTRPDGGVLVVMTRGKVELEVGKRGDRAPLLVRAGDTDVVVVGTRFSVDYGDGKGDVEVRVTEGVVRVVRHQRELRVAAGQMWQTDRGLLALAEPAPQTDPIEIDMSTPPNVALHDRVAKVPDARGSGAPSDRTITHPAAGSAVPRTLDNPNDPNVDLKALIRSQPVLPPMDVATPDPAGAIAKYQEIMIKQKGPDEAYAFYSMAAVQYLKLGRNQDALFMLDRFEKRAATSEYLVPALWLRVRIRCLQSIDDACRTAATAYLDRAQTGKSRDLAERITKTH
ncbi:MAG: FecR domain-containing protein, partial [Kofleriaceae bacterium]